MGDFEDKLAAKRAEQKAASEKAEALKQAQRNAGRNYANPARKEEAQRRFQELRSPAVPVARPAASPPPPPQIPSGANLNIEVWAISENSSFALYRDPSSDYWIPVRNGLIQLPTVSRPTDTPAGLVDIRISNVSPTS